MSIEPPDDARHEPGPERRWQESWYFNFSDPRSGLFGLLRTGLRPNEGRADALVLTVLDGRPHYVYPGVGCRYTPGRSDDVARGLRVGRLDLRAVEPLARWQLTLRGEDALDLDFRCVAPPYDYPGRGAGAEGFASSMAARHFEQVGHVSGWLRLHGRTFELDGYGQRDKSWGVRDWTTLAGWDWVSAHFGPELALNVLEVREGAGSHAAGFVWVDGRVEAVRAHRLRWDWGRRPHVPARGRLDIETERGDRLEVEATTRGRFPLYRGGALLEEIAADYVARRAGRTYRGTGVLEHVWRPPLVERLRRGPELASALLGAMAG
ncbi:MAG: hypothetical protein IT376_09270 [Polyangiaceae bacterium]|nr:hypothetical protein [Polyangiaceae bacterium]